MFHKTQSHCVPNFISADVLNNSYMYGTYKKKSKHHIFRNAKSKANLETGLY
jgi:hypothetical protein